MPEEAVGYVRLQWTCERCGTINPGPQKTCAGCGAPQPAEQNFELPSQEELVTDQKELEQAQAGPDIHCAYCGARNPASGKTCVQCGALLAEGTARHEGDVLGAAQFGPVPETKCPFCGAANPGNATKCGNCGGSLAQLKPKTDVPPPGGVVKRSAGISPLVIIAVVLACLVVAGGAFFVTRTHDQGGTVQATAWEQAVAVEAMRPVSHETWRDQVPPEARLGQCARKYRSMSSVPVPGAEKVCGTAYVKDKGSGYGKVVQNCEYKVYDDWCEYTVQEWQVVRTERATGGDLNPTWPDIRLLSDERPGARTQSYKCVFLSDDKRYDYGTNDLNLFQQCIVGSKWVVKVNNLGQITAIVKQ